ncbi:AAA family ATPase [uncultured Hymenobacter sp.]|uniref:AAA family ATPase n=1 Tax=uncultured Hymenobacter sp. TaxID=170016 RepID=UPI0035C9E835
MEETEEIEATARFEPSGPDVRLLRSLTLRNILSFGPDTPPLELRALNVLIGPNGSGKSNLLACLSLLPAMSDDISRQFREGGSNLKDWFRKDQFPQWAELRMTIAVNTSNSLVHQIQFTEGEYRPRIQQESIQIQPDLLPGETDDMQVVYRADFTSLMPVVEFNGAERKGFGVDLGASILAQLRDRTIYPSFSQLVYSYKGLAFFRDWTFGSGSPIRQPQRADSLGNFLREGGENLALVLNQLRRDSEAKARIVALLNELYEGIDDYETFVQGGYVELFLREGKQLIPASRLSDGTLRFLCLLAILCHPSPPPLICIEEPELGLHPDAVVAVGKLIKEASERTQLIVTTHSQILVDTFQDSPEDVVVVSREDGATRMKRLDPAKLRPYLKTYSLGNLWSSGDIGGNRW